MIGYFTVPVGIIYRIRRFTDLQFYEGESSTLSGWEEICLLEESYLLKQQCGIEFS